MANYHEDIVNIELESGNIHRSFLHHSIGQGDDRANRFGVRLFRNGAPENVSGSCFGLFIRADGATVAIDNGVVSGNVAYVTLPDTCYAVEGQFCLTIKVGTANDTITLRIVDGVVSRTSTNAAVDPGTIIPSVEDLIEEIEEAIAQIPEDYSELQSDIMMRQAIFPNMGANTVNALTIAYSNNVYTVTVNKDFCSYGIDPVKNNTLSIGKGYDCDYPMPATITSGSIVNFAILCFDITINTTNTWQIVSQSQFKANLNLRVLGVFYHGKAFLFDMIKGFFTNTLSSDDFNLYEKQRIASSAFWYTFISNTIAPITGRVNLIPSEHKITFDNVILAPSGIPGGFSQVLGSYAEVDWHNESNPNYARMIYLDNITGQLVALCYGQSHPTVEEVFDYRRGKNALALICIVYNGNFVYTCGAALPGRWYKNGVDIYAGNSDPVDLHKAFQKVGVVGDSLSVGYMYNKSTGTATSRMLKYSWAKEIMKETGVPWLNLGTSGQNVLTWCTNSTYGKVQAEASGNKCQAYIIGLGENDQSDTVRGIPLGTADDIVDNYQTVATTYYGGYARIIQILKHLNPDCKIFCLTNPRTGGNRAAYNEAVRYIAGTYYTATDNVFLVDLANNDGGEFNGSSFLPVDNSTIEGGHYSAIGYARIASIIAKEISNTIEANQTHFVNIAFIDYDTGTPTDNTMN